MTYIATQPAFHQASFDAFLQSRQEPQWLRQRRLHAWDVFRNMDWPSGRSEEWARTDIRLFKLDKYSLAAEAPQAAEPAAPLLSEGVELGGAAMSLNGLPVHSYLDPEWAARGVVFGALDQLIPQCGDLIQRHLLTRAVDPHYDRFSALHAACWSGGCFLYVPRGVTVDQPLHVFSTMTDGAADFGHLLVVLEEGAEATLLAETGSPGDSDGGFHCGAVELILGRGANLRFVGLQDWGKGAWHFAHQKAIVDRDAQLQWTVAALGGRLSKVNQHVSLIGPGAGCQVNGVLFAEGRQHVSYHTLQHHEAPSCRSDFLYKAALQDTSRTVWRGMIKVDPGAQKTDGYQRNDNLLLTPNARADSIPGLEIEADDVRCTHGSTTGRVDDELIFYARSRGFTRKEAVRVIVAGFFQQIFDRITIESVRDALAHVITRRVREYE